jgi:hypothetical protein
LTDYPSVCLDYTYTKCNKINCTITRTLLGCPSTLKNNEGKLARIIAKENEHKEAMKECKKAEKTEAKGRGSKPGTEPWAIRVRFAGFQ